MLYTSGADSTKSVDRKLATKKTVRGALTMAVSVGLVGTFALPAYATPAVPIPDTYVPANVQQFTAAEVDEMVAGIDFERASAPGADELAEVERREAAAEAEEAAEKAAAERRDAAATAGNAGAAGTPAASNEVKYVGGQGSGALLQNALAQLGVMQDCTALVENSLRALGLSVGDLGTSVGEYAQYGSVIPSNQAGPGDIIIRPGHVAIIVSTDGNRVTAVHGGWGGNQTVVADDGVPLGSYTVVRVG